MKRRILLFLGILLPLALFLPLRPVLEDLHGSSEGNMRQISISKSADAPGSYSYIRQIRRFSLKYGYKAALGKMMEDITRNEGCIGRNSHDDNRRLYMSISHFISKTGDIDQKTHYFRNRLNRCPDTLDKLLLENGKMPENKQWKLVPVKGSLYHMQGRDGMFNLKFVSYDGFCEAVYNKEGILLTERNDPVNMGTFNYSAGIRQEAAHKKYDVSPYFKWGNSPNSPQKNLEAIRKGTSNALEQYNHNTTIVNRYRERAAKRKGAAFATPLTDPLPYCMDFLPVIIVHRPAIHTGRELLSPCYSSWIPFV